MIKFPGLIDPHTHPRGLPSDDYKEDFYTATCAAIAGGFTTILDMPNNPFTPILTYELMTQKQNIAKEKAVCDIGFFFGTNGKNLDEFTKAAKISMGLKVFLSFSTGNLIIDHETFRKVCQTWTTKLPILLHAEEDTIEEALAIIKETGHAAHICHISSKQELEQIITAKKTGVPVTCGVTPHHLFLNETAMQQLGPFARMKPLLKSQKNVDFLWEHLHDIDVIESDHAPHTIDEKQSANPPFGVPGLETTLPLLLTAMHEGKITKEDIIDKCYTQPKKIFHVPDQPDTLVEVDENEEWTIENGKLFTKCNWSPFNGRKVIGRVKKVVLRGQKVFEDGKILAEPGFGRIV
jgi:dihydroorotase-like cyclic amidohydrolase